LLLDDGGNIGSYSFTSGSAEEEGAPADLDSGVSYADNLRIDEGGGPGIEDSALGEEDSEPGNESHAFGHEDHETVDEIDPAGQHDDEPGALADDEESLMSFASERGGRRDGSCGRARSVEVIPAATRRSSRLHSRTA